MSFDAGVTGLEGSWNVWSEARSHLKAFHINLGITRIVTVIGCVETVDNRCFCSSE